MLPVLSSQALMLSFVQHHRSLSGLLFLSRFFRVRGECASRPHQATVEIDLENAPCPELKVRTATHFALFGATDGTKSQGDY